MEHLQNCAGIERAPEERAGGAGMMLPCSYEMCDLVPSVAVDARELVTPTALALKIQCQAVIKNYSAKSSKIANFLLLQLMEPEEAQDKIV